MRDDTWLPSTSASGCPSSANANRARASSSRPGRRFRGAASLTRNRRRPTASAPSKAYSLQKVGLSRSRA